MRSALPLLTITLALAACGQQDRREAAPEASEQAATDTASIPANEAAPAPEAEADTPPEPEFISPRAMARADPIATTSPAFRRTDTGWQPLALMCDGAAGDDLVLIDRAEGTDPVTLRRYAKPSMRVRDMAVRLGRGDPGAGQVFYPINGPKGAPIGTVHAVNPGMIDPPDDATLPTTVSLKLNEEDVRCRWEPGGRILLVTPRRSVLVRTGEDGGFLYESFDHAKPGKPVEGPVARSSTPTLRMDGGRMAASPPGSQLYIFDNDGYRYRVTASSDRDAPGATVTVLKDGKVIQTERAIAYEVARPAD